MSSTINLQDYLSKQYEWFFEEYCSIDWHAHHQAISNWITKSSIFITKFIHNILPVGKIIQKYDAVKYTSTCPSCPHMCEDGCHFLLQYPRPHRHTWWSEIKKQLGTNLRPLTHS
jgi:hypothetical protein